MAGPRTVALFLAHCFLFACVVPEPQGLVAIKQDCAILGAFEEETAWLTEQLDSVQEHQILGCRFITGKVVDHRVVIALTGIGKVNAGMSTALVIEHFKPEKLIFTGVAGALNPELMPGDIVLGRTTVQHDLGTFTSEGITRFAVRNPINGVRNPVIFQCNEALLQLAEQVAETTEFETIPASAGPRDPTVTTGVIVTGDAFITSSAKKEELRHDLEADAVEMEGAAVAQICYQLKVPCLIVRALSDKSDEYAEQDFERFYQVAARNANRIVLGMLENPGF